jgi:PAS domain-containing protein
MLRDTVQEYHDFLVEILVIGIVIYFFIFALIFYLASKIDNYFQGALQLLRRLSPYCIISNPPLFRYLFQKSEDNSSSNSNVYASLYRHSSYAIFCLNRNESIEMVNPAVTPILGYTPEQLLGQHISFVLPTDQTQNIFTQMTLMKEGQCSLFF